MYSTPPSERPLCSWGSESEHTFAVVAAKLEQAVEDEAGAHRVANQNDRPVPMGLGHQNMRQQTPRLHRALQRHSKC